MASTTSSTASRTSRPAGLAVTRPGPNTIAAIVCSALLLVAMLGLSRDFGATWDERWQQHYGEQIWDYLHGRIPRATFDTSVENQYLYSGLVEVIAVAVQRVVRADTYVIRHYVSAVFGWAGILFCGLTAGGVFGARAGWIAAALLTLSPRYFGDAMNNSKDVPFAAMVMAVLALTLTIDWERPWLSIRRAAALTAAIAFAINVRPLGVALLLYSAGVIGLAALAHAVTSDAPDRWRRLVSTTARLAGVAIVAVPLGTLAWPWAQGQPFVRPIEAFLVTTRLDWARGFPGLFAGQQVIAGALPWSYVPTWLGIMMPPVVIAGAAVSWLTLGRGLRERAAWLGLVAFAGTPVVAAIVRNATLYDGIRHMSFVVPPIVALAGAGWGAVLLTRARTAGIVLLAVASMEPLWFQVRNHPNQIVYFSPVVGGPKGAFARYDMDYWGNSMLEAVAWADRVAQASGFPLILSGNPVQVVIADASRFRSLQVVGRTSDAHHLDIRLMRGPSASLREFAARPDILYTVRSADGTPLCLVLPGPAFHLVSDRLALAGTPK